MLRLCASSARHAFALKSLVAVSVAPVAQHVCTSFGPTQPASRIVSRSSIYKKGWTGSPSRRFSTQYSSNIERLVTSDPANNISARVAEKVGRQLHLMRRHPLNTIKTKIEAHFAARAAALSMPSPFTVFDRLDPIVTTKANFDDLLVAPDHISRARSDTYYIDGGRVLRTHTSAHQSSLIGAGHHAFLCTGDVYRRDEIDASHYPVFHQMEGVRVFSDKEIDPSLSREARVAIVEADLKVGLEGMVESIFGAVEKRWIDAYFPFTDPSFELEIFFQGDWLEVLGCGVIQQPILRTAGAGERVGWAFGLGLERLAMVLFGIPDIRLFWSEDPRFLGQFREGEIVRFEPYSKFPPCYKDVSFWLPLSTGSDLAVPASAFHPNDVFEAVREIAGDLVEEVRLIDDFSHPKTGQRSLCFRVNYRSMDRNLTNAEVDAMQFRFRDALVAKFGVQLR